MDGDQVWLVALVAVGGALGSVARYLASGFVTRGDFPWGTFFVNVTGSFLLALLFFLALQRGFLSPEVRALVFIGVFGAFSLETVTMFADGQWTWAVENVFLNGGLCVVGAFLGRAAGLFLGGT
ncbi:MAG: CrcB family protein [Thermoplasmata archaeon]